MVLIEGNRFKNSKEPLTKDSSKAKVWSRSGNACKSVLGRDCQTNALTDSGALADRADSSVLSELAKYKSSLVTPIPIGNVMSTVVNGAGVGRI
jgi:hypothetical protein